MKTVALPQNLWGHVFELNCTSQDPKPLPISRNTAWTKIRLLPRSFRNSEM